MTLGRFEKLLKMINPKLRVRQKAYGDVGGLFVGLSGKSGYIIRISKGELNLAGYRQMLVDKRNPFKMLQGNIKKRGRKTLIMILKNYRWITGPKQVSMLLWGIEPKGDIRSETQKVMMAQ